MNGEELEFVIHDGILIYKARICVPSDQQLKQEIMTQAHQSSFSIHPGSTKMYQELRETFWC